MTISKYLVGLGLLALSFAMPAFLPTQANAQAASSGFQGYQSAPAYSTYPSQQLPCPSLSYNLYRGLSDYQTGGQVSQLQNFLGYYFISEPVPVTGYYGPITTNFVARFQQQQGVYPVTGGVGPLTRAAIARICGGGGTSYPPPPSTYGGVSITNISGPNAASVGQAGTWSITTNAPYGAYLSVSVRWGDENVYPYSSSPQALGYVSQQNTFSHTYYQAGTYTITFTVTDNTGYSASANTTVIVGGDTGGCYYPYYNNCQTNISVTSPTSGQSYGRGSQVPVVWSGNGNGNSSVSTIIDLYSASGNKVGTLAVQGGASGNYSWTIPAYPGSQYCTMQYPNPQCLSVPDGQYYIKATLVQGNGFDNGSTLSSAQSGTFTVSGGGGGGNNAVSAYPTSGYAPLTVTFSVTTNGLFAVDFGDGSSASLQQGTVSHTYHSRGTYTATFRTDYTCLHSNPSCSLAQQKIGSVTITVY